jgi:Fic family protein
MTTLIDRIMKRIDELKKSTCTKSIVDELERVKAELTAVKGVDELIEKRIKKCLRTILKTLDKDGMIRRSKIISQFDLLLSDLKSLKQTPVVSKPNKIIREWRIID